MILLLVFAVLANGEDDILYKIGTTAEEGSLSYAHMDFAVKRWNNERSHPVGLSLLASRATHVQDKVCELLGKGIVALFLAPSTPSLDIQLAASMCNHYNIPCIAFYPPKEDEVSPMVTWMSPSRSAYSQASKQLLSSLRWTSFVIAYQEDSDVEEMASLLTVSTIPRPIIHARRLPRHDIEMEPFLKYIRNTVKETRVVLHSSNISTLYNLMSLATTLNMTQPPYSYFFINTDLALLEDFLTTFKSLHCNMSGLQLVHSRPPLQTDIALAADGVFTVGKVLWSLYSDGKRIEAKDLLCSANDTWEDGARMIKGLRSTEYASHLTGNVRFDIRGHRTDVQLQAIARVGDTFEQIGNWSEPRGWQFTSSYTNRWKFSIEPHQTHLKGLTLRVVVYIEEPFVMKNRDGGYHGFCIDLLEEMANILKFNYTITEVVDGTYGTEDETGRWNGIIGVLQRNEADLSVSAVTITYSRVEVIDFTLPFMHLGISILLARQSEDSSGISLFTFLEPLSLSVWICLLGAYLSVSFSMWMLARFSPYEWYDVERMDERDMSMSNHKNQFTMLNSLWFSVGSLMQQGSDVIPRAAATRIVAVIWWMFTQILISSYTAQLAAFLTVERMATPIESSADLANQQKIRYGTLKSGSTMDFFRESKIPIYERMWSIMDSSSPSVFVNSSREGIARVKAGNYAYMMESTMLEYYMERDCQLQSIGGLLDSKGYGIALPKGSPLRDIMSRSVLQLQERTILESLKNKWWKDRRGDAPICTHTVENSPASSLKSVYGIFYVLLTGLIVALLMAVGEYCIESRRDSIRLQFTIPGKIQEWWHSLIGAEREKGRRKLVDIHLDSIGQSSCKRIERNLVGEELRRLSRLMPFADESLLHQRLRPSV